MSTYEKCFMSLCCCIYNCCPMLPILKPTMISKKLSNPDAKYVRGCGWVYFLILQLPHTESDPCDLLLIWVMRSGDSGA